MLPRHTGVLLRQDAYQLRVLTNAKAPTEFMPRSHATPSVVPVVVIVLIIMVSIANSLMALLIIVVVPF